MDGVHDMGGMHGFGKVEPEKDEPTFHAPWEGRVLAMEVAMEYAGAWRIDHSRFAQEKLPPLTYLSVSYYHRWALALESNLTERGYVSPEELSAGHGSTPGKTLPRKLRLDAVGRGLHRGSFYRSQQAPARFKPGDQVRTKKIHPKTHTRLPRYARDKVGEVEICRGCQMYPDSVATDQSDNPQWLYTVVFESQVLWGPDADPTLKVSIDAFEPYLEPA